jgi:hypothetical protein
MGGINEHRLLHYHGKTTLVNHWTDPSYFTAAFLTLFLSSGDKWQRHAAPLCIGMAARKLIIYFAAELHINDADYAMRVLLSEYV